MRGWWGLVWLCCGACFAGVGPNAGYDVKKGWFAGIEAGGGFVLPEAVFGYQTAGNVLYGRIDANVDNAGNPGTGGVGARIGGGAGFSLSGRYDPHGMFVAGPNLSVELSSGPSGRCADFPQGVDVSNRAIFEAALELRYLREWQFVLATQIGCTARSTGD